MFSGYIDVAVLPAFLGAVVLLMVMPGPVMAFMVATGLRDGRRAAARAAFGVNVGVSVYVVLTALGLGALLAAMPQVGDVIRLCGAGYLGYLAWTTWRSAGDPVAVDTPPQPRAFRRGFLVNLSNPKILLFFTAFLPQFLGDAAANPALQLLVLGLLLQLVGLVVDLVTGQLAGAVRDRVLARPRVRTLFERLSATVYGVLGAALVADSVR
ncbi:Threonine/homoserine/homoserine lactone efflux protein [Prauserella aidingensis]|uniref:LysE family translocator n=1 Tax=Prauserella aidingensis TaxID=387890 RepID=UPI0020A5F8C7|nr:LysE family translocator [Prauserella aidingensis]MCP2254216.1 Threonine/homoserine/homoserine lactone efflux protein [Prauserella aidingensis]